MSKWGEVAVLSSAWKLTQRMKEMRKQGTMFKTKKQSKSPETDLNEM